MIVPVLCTWAAEKEKGYLNQMVLQSPSRFWLGPPIADKTLASDKRGKKQNPKNTEVTKKTKLNGKSQN